MPDIGFVGLGEMGGPMAVHLLNAGYEVTVYDRGQGLEPAREAGARVVDTYPAVARNSEVVFLCLPGPDVVRTVVVGDCGLVEGLNPGSVVVDATTSLPAITNDLATDLAAREVSLFSAPISGGRAGAEAGTLSVIVSGDGVIFEELEPVLETFASNVFYVGERPGRGHALKLINNFIMCAGYFAACEGIVLGRQAGFEMDTMLDVINESSGQNFATSFHFSKYIADGSYDIGAPIAQLEEDLQLFARFADSLELPVLYGDITRNIVGFARAHQGAETDITECFTFFEDVMEPPR